MPGDITRRILNSAGGRLGVGLRRSSDFAAVVWVWGCVRCCSWGSVRGAFDGVGCGPVLIVVLEFVRSVVSWWTLRGTGIIPATSVKHYDSRVFTRCQWVNRGDSIGSSQLPTVAEVEHDRRLPCFPRCFSNPAGSTSHKPRPSVVLLRRETMRDRGRESRVFTFPHDKPPTSYGLGLSCDSVGKMGRG